MPTSVETETFVIMRSPLSPEKVVIAPAVFDRKIAMAMTYWVGNRNG